MADEFDVGRMTAHMGLYLGEDVFGVHAVDDCAVEAVADAPQRQILDVRGFARKGADRIEVADDTVTGKRSGPVFVLGQE